MHSRVFVLSGAVSGVTASIVLVLCSGFASPPAIARPNLLSAINAVRAAGCGGKRGVSTPLRANEQLNS
ncbi:MAG TPA: hypothetical protein VGO53_12265, partial [Steroidobacteraceae bacterium]|nr:hypothetical protein [Steroidobacteraceae bacterium]